MTRDFTKGARTSFYAMLFGMGAVFWVTSVTGHFSMSEDVYGAQVMAIPSEVWAGAMFFPAAIYLIALWINGKRRWTPLARVICGGITATYFSVFIVSALPAAGGDLMTIASAVMMLKAGVYVYVDACELLRQVKGRRNE